MFGDVYLLDFYEKKTKSTQLIIYKDLRELPIEPDLLTIIDELFDRSYNPKILLDILSIGKGNISLCGLAISNELMYQSSDEYNLYIHSCDLLEANKLLRECLNIIGDLSHYQIDNYILIKVNGYFVRIFLEVYNDREQILRNNESILDKHGWDPIKGYFCTTSKLSTMLMDITREDSSLEQCVIYDETIADCTKHYAFYNINRDITPNLRTRDIIYIFGNDRIISPRLIENVNNCHMQLSNVEAKLFLENQPKINVRQYLDEIYNYNYISVGISDDRYVAFSGIRILYNIDDDIFTLLCNCWLEAEYYLVKEKMFK